jgi:hypothetical protein
MFMCECVMMKFPVLSPPPPAPAGWIATEYSTTETLRLPSLAIGAQESSGGLPVASGADVPSADRNLPRYTKRHHQHDHRRGLRSANHRRSNPTSSVGTIYVGPVAVSSSLMPCHAYKSGTQLER